LGTAYGQNVMSEGNVKQWCRVLIDGGEEMFMMKSKVVSWRSTMSDDLILSFDHKICKRQHFTTLELSCEFPQISHVVLYEIITVRLGYHKFCARWFPKMLMGAHKTHRMALALTFFTPIPQSWRCISQSHCTGNR
jgi:hypothetical protein